jgi:hypothetical protein
MATLQDVRNSVRAGTVPRKSFVEPAALDRTVHMCMAVAAEAAVTADRLDRLERRLAARGLLDPGELDAVGLTPEEHQERLRWHEAFMERILRVVMQDIEILEDGEAAAPRSILTPGGKAR